MESGATIIAKCLDNCGATDAGRESEPICFQRLPAVQSILTSLELPDTPFFANSVVPMFGKDAEFDVIGSIEPMSIRMLG